MPAVIEQDTAACYRPIDAPVCAPLGHHGGSRLRAQRLPTDGSDTADRAVSNQCRDLQANRGFEPVVNRVHNSSGVGRSHGDCLDIRQPDNKRLFAKNVKTGLQRSFNEHRMAARWRTYIDEVQRFAGQQFVHASVPPCIGTRLKKSVAARCKRIGRRHDLHIIARLPAGQMAFRRNVSESDKGAPQHAS
jgi:hypothetical protein